MNLANNITIIRFILIPFFIASVLYGRLHMALAIFIVAFISDGLDGYIARHFNQKTKLGAMIDPLADKLLIVSAFICLVFIDREDFTIVLPPYVPVIIISRDIMILLGSILIYMLKGDLEVKPNILGKITTFFQMITIITVLMQLRVSIIIWNVAIILTVMSGLVYLIRGNKILNEKV